jgi:alkylhydroperoxidase family enzyme
MSKPQPIDYGDDLSRGQRHQRVAGGYCTASHSAAARKAGMTDAMFGEVMAVVGIANETNRLANGYRVPIDPAFE